MLPGKSLLKVLIIYTLCFCKKKKKIRKFDKAKKIMSVYS